MSHNQKKVRECASDAAEYLLAKIDGFQKMPVSDRQILIEIATELLIKYFNGREIHLLSREYVLAEIGDVLMLHNEEIKNRMALQFATAQFAVEFDKFIKEYDDEYSDSEVEDEEE